MGRRRRRKVVKIVRKTLPKVFVCPRCGARSVKVLMNVGAGKAKVTCSICGLTAELPVSPSSQPVDIYCRFSDLFYARKLG
ncbi:MAG: hypothetical protein AYL30_000180 [Candidatus Hecatellales archaeon B24]|nr:MAG: hypothetical protein AYL30_000180 [Candidatus Hecatellales archaeon B24]